MIKPFPAYAGEGTFEENGGSEVPDQTVQYGEKIKKPADPIREGYYLKGWYSDLDCTELWDFDQDTVQENMTLYAGWAVKDTLGGASTPNRCDGFPWWILMTVLGSGLLLMILEIYSRKSISAVSGNHADDNSKDS